MRVTKARQMNANSPRTKDGRTLKIMLEDDCEDNDNDGDGDGNGDVDGDE